MTALSQLRSLIDRELGTSGWEYTEVESYGQSDGPGVLRTQRGFIPFSTLKVVVELIPALLEEQRGLVDAQREEAWQEGYNRGQEEGYDDGYASAKEDYGND